MAKHDEKDQRKLAYYQLHSFKTHTEIYVVPDSSQTVKHHPKQKLFCNQPL